MITEAIEKILDLSAGKILTAAGRPYSMHELEALPVPDAPIEPLRLHTLDGLSGYVSDKFDGLKKCAMFVDGPAEVSLRSEIFGEFRQRDLYAVSTPFIGKGFGYGRYMAPEDFVVSAQSCFVQDETTEAILRVVGNITSQTVNTVVDDGVSQTVTARAGIARVENVELPNPIMLRPYRTFQEIEQPQSKFILRMRGGVDDGPPEIALFETDSMLWKAAAVGLIAERLEDVGNLKVYA